MALLYGENLEVPFLIIFYCKISYLKTKRYQYR